MTASMPLRDDRMIVLRRRRVVRLIEGKPQGVYTDTFEIICPDCGDDPTWDYHDVPPGLQNIRGPYWIEAGAREYEAHIAWHEARGRRGTAAASPLWSRCPEPETSSLSEYRLTGPGTAFVLLTCG